MDLAPRYKVTKAKLGGLEFLYNPSSFDDAIAVTYNDLKTAGISYPILGYGGGDRRTVTFDIYLNDKVKAGITKKWINHLETFVPPRRKKGYQFVAPKKMIFAYGVFVAECYLTNMNVQRTAFYPNLDPLEATIQVTLALIQ